MPAHRHQNSQEAIYVLEGSAILRLADKEYLLECGDYASIPPGTAFFCLNGRVRMTAGEEQVSLSPGDFLHVPARTPHTFQLTGNYNRFIQFHAPGFNEPFFRYMCEACEEHTFLQPPPPFRFDRVMQHHAELDVKYV